jgi:hypothetical protein
MNRRERWRPADRQGTVRSALLVALAVLLAACAAPASSPTGPSPTTAPPTSTSPTRICDLGPENPRFTCTEVIGKVLLAMGPEAASVRAAWFRHGSPCPPNARCMAPPPGSAYVVLRLESGGTRVFPLTLDGAEPAIGAVTEPTFDIWPPSGEPIPEVRRPALDGAPAEIADRLPVPLCWDEAAGVFESRLARQCFYGAVLDGRPAELHARSSDEIGGFSELYRYAGRGPVLVYQNRPKPVDPGWVRKDCAIGLPIEDVPGDDELFFFVSECLSAELS